MALENTVRQLNYKKAVRPHDSLPEGSCRSSPRALMPLGPAAGEAGRKQ